MLDMRAGPIVPDPSQEGPTARISIHEADRVLPSRSNTVRVHLRICHGSETPMGEAWGIVVRFDVSIILLV